MAFTLTAQMISKTNFSRVHLQSAETFLERCVQIESEESSSPWPQPHWEESRSCACAVVMMTVAALEASINELFQDASDGSVSLRPISAEAQNLLTALWDDVDQFNVLRKYNVVLTACGAKPFARGEEPYQSAAALVDLRNALVHYKSEWDNALDKHAKLETKLKSRFPTCKLTDQAQGTMAWFPHRCLGAGCATWAIKSAKAYVRQFTQQLSIPARFD